MNKRMLFLIAIYGLFIHVLLVVMLVKTDAIELFQRKLGVFDPKFTELYLEMSIFYKRIDAQLLPGSILFIGDSLIQGLCVICIEKNSVNFGIGQDTVYGVSARIDGYKSIGHAKAVILAIGINDLLRMPPEEVFMEYEILLDKVPNEVEIIVAGLLPIDSKFANKNFRINSNINRLNSLLKSRCNTRDSCIYFDVNKSLKGVDGNLMQHYHIGDGLHLSPLGYKIWIEGFKKNLLAITSKYGVNDNV